MTCSYGASPEALTEFAPEWAEYLHYLYLPVVMPGQGDEIRLPRRLEFLRPVVEQVIEREGFCSMDDPRFVYVTARRGWASPGNPLNRPGWHADGFGSDDVNYVWSDRFPTRFALGQFDLPAALENDHVGSVKFWEMLVASVEALGPKSVIGQIVEASPGVVYRLDPSVVHATPEVPTPGGDRSFFKISVSSSRYNLAGNSHNYAFDYAWRMFDRDELRNDPSYAGGDAGPQEVER